jgi:hypothetical protein
MGNGHNFTTDYQSPITSYQLPIIDYLSIQQRSQPTQRD